MEAIFTRLTSIIVLSFFILSCSTMPLEDASTVQVPENSGSLILFNERSVTDPEHISRFIITEKYLRIDYGNDTDDFILFDRSKNIIYSIVHADRSIMKMASNKSNDNNMTPVIWQESSEKSQALPRLSNDENGMATHHKLSLQGQTCYDIVALDKMLEEENLAIVQYNSALASELKKSYKPSQDSLCSDAINILDTNKRYSYGFPYREWSSYGYQRFMVNFRQKLIFPDSLFSLPPNYRQY